MRDYESPALTVELQALPLLTKNSQAGVGSLGETTPFALSMAFSVERFYTIKDPLHGLRHGVNGRRLTLTLEYPASLLIVNAYALYPRKQAATLTGCCQIA